MARHRGSLTQRIQVKHRYLAALIACMLARSGDPALNLFAQPINPPSVGDFQFSSAGILTQTNELLPGLPFPDSFAVPHVQDFFHLRDEVYNGAPSERIESHALALLKNVPASTPDTMLRVYTARVAYLSGRSWNDHGDKKNAIRWFEEAVGSAQDLIKMEGETPVALLCLADPLAELCLLKDLGFLMTNGPKIGRYADKVLAIDPSNVKALLLKASALAYPPPIWGGNYKKALTMYADILAEASSGLPPDLLFDVRAGIATAYANLRLKDHALWWFRAALELYPTNPYATRMIKELTR